jgi:hypothetical protein
LQKISSDPGLSPTFEELRLLGERRRDLVAKQGQGTNPEVGREIQNIEAAIQERSNAVVVTYALRDFDAKTALAVAAPPESTSGPSRNTGRRGARIRAVLMRFLGSQGLATDLGFIRKNVERIATILLVVSLLSWSSEAMANSLSLAATNLQVVFDKYKATRSLNEALSMIPPPAETAPASTNADVARADVARVSRSLAHEFVNQIVNRDLPESLGLRANGARQYEEEATRLAILDSRVDPAHPGSIEDVIRSESLSSDIAAKGANAQADGIATKLSAKLAPRLEEIRERSPGLWAKIVDHAHTYNVPLPLWDAQQKLLGTAIEQALSGAELNSGTEIARQASKIVSEFGQNALTTWIDGHVQDYLGHLVVESLPPNALLQLAHPHTLHLAVKEDTRDLLTLSSGADGIDDRGWHTVRKNLITGEDESRRAMLAKVDEVAGQRVSAEVRETVLGYDALFPGGSRTVTQAVEEVAENVARQAASSGLQTAMQVSMNFLGAARGGRARGVIFGRSIDGNGPALSDIRWSDDQDGRIQLQVLPTGSEEWRDLGSFASGTVNQALRYAADRRVVAVTMVPGSPFARLEIQLNPELLDTALGCRVVTIDRFVDTLDSAIPIVVEHRHAVEKLQLLMNVVASHPAELCNAKQSESALDNLLKSRTPPPPQFVDRVRTAVKADPAALAAVSAALECGQRVASNEAIACACEARPEIQAAKALYVPNDVTSQVREREFTADPQFSWMRRSDNALGDLEFWLHMTLQRQTKDGQPYSDPATDSDVLAIDFADDDLRTLNETMPKLIKSYVTSPKGLDTPYTTFMRPIEDFVILQRFFRLALESKFGPAFPKQKLITLERSTRTLVKKQVTLRWQIETKKQAELLQAVSDHEFQLWRSYEDANQGRQVCESM